MLAPLLIAHALGGTTTLSATIPAAFLVAMVLLVGLHLRIRHTVPPIAVVVAIWLGVVQTLPLWWGSLVGDPLMLGDLANVAVKPMVFVVLVGLFYRASITVSELTVLTYRFSLLVFFVSLYGFVAGLASFVGMTPGMSSYSVDYSSFLANRNQFGMLVFLGVASLLLTRAMRGPQRHDLLIGITLLISVALTMSRGSLLGVAILLGIVAAARKTTVFFLFLAPTLLLTAVVASLHPFVRLYVVQFFIRPDVGLSGRNEIWAIGLALVFERPLQGWGSFVGLAEAEALGMGVGQFHSFWLEQLIDWGTIGLLTMLVLLFVVWGRAYRPAPAPVRRVLLGTGAGAIAMGTFESISVLSVGYVDIVWTISLMTIPVLIARVAWYSTDRRRVEGDFRQVDRSAGREQRFRGEIRSAGDG
ncbi:O-antigen ligase family protein [Ornithinimicrobium sp. W1679]|uniref:O-antigen ligase family protein n=1 Tax=Ornithinimicrobium sp. W1679 TaxID=3418770 RepID=UPI003CED2A32